MYRILLLLVTGLAIAIPVEATTTSGTIAVTLTVFAGCGISRPNEHHLPSVNCGQRIEAQPHISQSLLQPDAHRQETVRLVTIEW